MQRSVMSIMMQDRFRETVSTGIVTDTVTGKEYNCDVRIDEDLLALMNELDWLCSSLLNDYTKLARASSQLEKDYDEVIKVLLKYNIDNVEKLDRVLFEARIW